MLRRLIPLTVIMAVVLSFVVAPSPVKAQAACLQTYIVRRGDNLFRIGLRFGLRFTRLQAMNGLSNPNRIRVGQRLCVRASGMTVRTSRRVATPTPRRVTTPTRRRGY